jgi:hypothetical protein
MLGKFPNTRSSSPADFVNARLPSLNLLAFFHLARFLQCCLRGPNHGPPDKKGSFQMTVSARQTATAIAAAFITSMLFISSATSALPIA